jgi:hypothetical protein
MTRPPSGGLVMSGTVQTGSARYRQRKAALPKGIARHLASWGELLAVSLDPVVSRRAVPGPIAFDAVVGVHALPHPGIGIDRAG